VAPSREERESITLSSWPPHLGHRILVLPLLIVVVGFVPHKIWGSQAPGAEFLNHLKTRLLEKHLPAKSGWRLSSLAFRV
jgi:hypothetical protein